MNSDKLLTRLTVLTLLLALLASGTIPKRVESRSPDTPTTEQETPRQMSSETAWTDINSPEAKRIYVDRDATTGGNNGDSWTNAYTNLQNALESAAYGDGIWVAEGIYIPTTGVTRTAAFTLVNGVALYGGFAGTEIAREERDWEAHVTVLSGDLDGNDTTDTNGVVTNTNNITGSNAYRIVTGGGVTETAVLDGFTIIAGGNGLYNSNSAPTLVNITFTGSYAGNGGGMYNDNSNPGLTNVAFNDNEGVAGGGGMYSQKESAPVLTDVSFSGNKADLGGGMYNLASDARLTNCILWGNRVGSAENEMAQITNDNGAIHRDL